jgi:hypothetical protein
MILQRDLSKVADDKPIVMTEVTDQEELARAREQDERFQRNWEWFQAHIHEVYQANRGKVICISGEELFAADTGEEVLSLAKAAHPDDDGRFTRYIPRERMCRVYAAAGGLGILP